MKEEKNEKPKKEIKNKKETKKDKNKPKDNKLKNVNKKEEIKPKQEIKNEDQKFNEQKFEDLKINDQNKKEIKIEQTNSNGLETPIPQKEETPIPPKEENPIPTKEENPIPTKEENIPPQLKEGKDSTKTTDTLNLNKLPKTLLTKKTEDNYDLMMKYFKDNYKGNEEYIKSNIINYEDFSSDKFLGLVSEKLKTDNANKNMIDDFLQRNIDDTKQRQDNDKSINERIKLINDSKNKKLFFNNKQSQKDYFDSFYNKQIQYKNNYKEHLDKLTQKYNEEKKKNYAPEPKLKNNLDYFKNNEPVKISKYSFKAHKLNKRNNENSKNEPKIKKIQSFEPIQNNNNSNNNKNNDSNNNNDNNKGKDNKKFVKTKSDPLFQRKEIKLSKKEIEELSNKLHYDGELLKIKKQELLNEELANNKNYHSFSKEKLTRSSMTILIKKLLYEFSVSIKKNACADYAKNPKINYDQYIDILKDLYYLDIDALPEDYLEEETTYKELWNKLTMFSNGPENSIESNVFLLFLLELNGFFINECIIRELEKEIDWIKLEEYDDLIANAKYIEDNWYDLKIIKNENIKKLRQEGKYNPIHCEELYNHNSINKNSNFSSLINNSNHFITTIKGNTNYHIIHGYNSNNKNSEISLSGLSNLFNKNEENNQVSFSISNFMSNKNLKNRKKIKDSYKDLIIKKKENIENMRKDEEKKLKEICTFKPKINTINKKVFSNMAKVELPKYKKNIIQNNDKNSFNQENGQNKTNINNNINIIKNKNQENIISNNFYSFKNVKEKNPSHSPNLKNGNKKMNKNEIKRNKSSLQKMFKDNPLKNDKQFNEKIQKLKMARINGKEAEKNNNSYLSPMRFDIDFPSKFEGIGVTANRNANIRQNTQNVIFYNIKINETIKTLKYVEGEDLKLNVTNFARKNKLPDDVIDIIFNKIKEKTIEEIL